MDRPYRKAFNAAFSPEMYRAYLARLARAIGGDIPFRVAETPLFVPQQLHDRLASHARAIVDRICDPELIAKLAKIVPAELDVPRRDALSNCIQVDFAICRDANGELDGKLVELQGFPSLYAFTVVQLDALNEQLATVDGLRERWSAMFSGHSRDSYIAKLRHTLLADASPDEVILMDLDPPGQKTSPDFVATKKLVGIDAVCPTELERDGRRLVRTIGGRSVAVRRIFNRVVFDELAKKGMKLPFAYTDDLDVTWIPHPNWYWIWSKYTVPFIDHPSVPKARFVSEIATLPSDLSNFVLKPLFSFAGAGVRVDVSREDIDAIPDTQRSEWILQEKITYAPDVLTPRGDGIKAEIRMMFLREPGEARPELVINLVRMSRGKMLGVDQNKDLDWVGGTIGIWPERYGA